MAEIKITQKYNNETFLEEIECVVAKADFDKNFEKAIDAVSKIAVAPGFRKGHVPRNVVLRNNLQQISDKAIDLSIQEAAENITDLEPRPLEPLNIKSITPTEDGGLTVVFTYIPFPSVKLGKLDSLKVAKVDAKKATEEEITKELENIWFHYQGRLDSSIKKEDFAPEKLDADFFEKTDIKNDNPALTSAEELRKFLEDYINQTYEADANMSWEKQAQEKIVEAGDYDKVDALIEKELDKRLQNYKAKFTQIGMNADDYMKSNNVNPDDLKKEWKPQAERDVKLELVLQKYGEEKGFEPTEDDMQENLANLDAETKKMYDNDESRIRSLIRYYFINQKSYNDILDSIRKNSGIEVHSHTHDHDHDHAEEKAPKKKSKKTSEKTDK
jgi:FKBP-type peptidyl-prolyl cis-trans isomerase (trigger factor)